MEIAKGCACIQGVEFLNCDLETQEQDALRTVFGHFFDMSRRYAAHCNDKPNEWNHAHWVYRERAHIGFFAAAVWLGGGLALEEYSSEKTRTQEGEAGAYKGRGDLWFSLAGPTNFAVEAKHMVAKLIGSDKKFEPIQKKLGDARKNAEQKRELGDYPLGLVFVTLDSPEKNESTMEVTAAINQWKQDAIAFASNQKCLFLAWFFPAEARKLTETHKGRKYRNPGVAVFASRPKDVHPT